jgi:ribosomal protein S18 acetylase RimI-like enzyme
MANALNRHEGLAPRAFTPTIVRRDAFGRRRAFRVVVAEAGGGIVGYASFLPGYNTDIARPELWMLDLYVQAPWRSRGIGRALVTTVARETVRRGLTCLEWGVRSDNTRAKTFYGRLGARVGNSRVASLIGRPLARLASGRA